MDAEYTLEIVISHPPGFGLSDNRTPLSRPCTSCFVAAGALSADGDCSYRPAMLPLPINLVLLDPEFELRLRAAGFDDVDRVLARQDGEPVKTNLAIRQVHRFRLGDATIYVKRYFDIPRGEALEYYFSRAERSAARREWEALGKLSRSGLAAPRPLACGEFGRLRLVRRAFLVTLEFPFAETLESFVRRDDALACSWRRPLLHAIADYVRRMHDAGINHRDLYLGHVVLLARGDECPAPAVIDLNRADVRQKVRRRWRVKDLAALEFSAPERLVSRRERLRFLVRYLAGDHRNDRREVARLVAAKSARMRRHVENQVARGLPNFHVPE